MGSMFIMTSCSRLCSEHLALHLGCMTTTANVQSLSPSATRRSCIHCLNGDGVSAGDEERIRVYLYVHAQIYIYTHRDASMFITYAQMRFLYTVHYGYLGTWEPDEHEEQEQTHKVTRTSKNVDDADSHTIGHGRGSGNYCCCG